MSKTMHVELTEEQRDVLLRGLRYIRSSWKLTMRAPSPEWDVQRADELKQIASLSQQLADSPTSREPAKVS